MPFDLQNINSKFSRFYARLKNLYTVYVNELVLALSLIGFAVGCYWGQFMPNVSFLQAVIAVEAAIIAIAFPLTADIIGRISERYGSDAVAKRFVDKAIVRWSLVGTLFHIVVSSALLFFIKDGCEPLNGILVIFLWADFLSFIIVVFVFYKFLMTVKEFIVSRESVIKDLFKDSEEFLQHEND